MDRELLAWGRRSWGRRSALDRKLGAGGLPRLWLFTDPQRLPDPRPAVARLPCGRAGVVLRHDDDPGRPALARDLARLCRARRLVLVVAGDVRLAAELGAGVHLRAGRWCGFPRKFQVVTSSAHTLPELRRAARAGAALAFLSPAFPTQSHPGAPALGPLRWAAMARRLRTPSASMRVGALGGVDGSTIRRLPPAICQAAGAIGALS